MMMMMMIMMMMISRERYGSHTRTNSIRVVQQHSQLSSTKRDGAKHAHAPDNNEGIQRRKKKKKKDEKRDSNTKATSKKGHAQGSKSADSSQAGGVLESLRSSLLSV